jgi:hypothetical protein
MSRKMLEKITWIRNSFSVRISYVYSIDVITKTMSCCFRYDVQPCPRIHWLSIRGSQHPEKKLKENWRNKLFLSLKTRAKRERTVTWWNPAAQKRPVLNSSSFARVLTLPSRTCLHSAFSVLAVRISCRVIALFVFRKLLFIN